MRESAEIGRTRRVASVREWLRRTRVTEPPPVGPWIGVVGMLVGLSGVGLAYLVYATAAALIDGDVWPLPAWLALGVVQLALLFRLSRALTTWEIEGWPQRRSQRHWRPYIAGGLGFAVAAVLDEGTIEPGLATAVGLVATAALAARLRRAELALAFVIFGASFALAALADPVSDLIGDW